MCGKCDALLFLDKFIQNNLQDDPHYITGTCSLLSSFAVWEKRS